MGRIPKSKLYLSENEKLKTTISWVLIFELLFLPPGSREGPGSQGSAPLPAPSKKRKALVLGHRSSPCGCIVWGREWKLAGTWSTKPCLLPGGRLHVDSDICCPGGGAWKNIKSEGEGSCSRSTWRCTMDRNSAKVSKTSQGIIRATYKLHLTATILRSPTQKEVVMTSGALE